MEVQEALKLALSVARRMSRDPEAEGLANEAVAYVFRNPRPGVPIEAQVRVVTKCHVWYWWRQNALYRPKLVQEPEDGWPHPAEGAEHASELPKGVTPYDWMLLHERYVERRPLCQLAARRGLCTSDMKRALLRAEDRLIVAMLLAEADG